MWIFTRENPCALSVLRVLRTEKEEESKLVLLMNGGRVIFHNTCDGTPNNICDLEPQPRDNSSSGELDYRSRGAYQYFETLFRV